MTDNRKPDGEPSDKFILAMIALSVFLLIIMVGGFAAMDYFKAHPEAFEVRKLEK